MNRLHRGCNLQRLAARFSPGVQELLGTRQSHGPLIRAVSPSTQHCALDGAGPRPGGLPFRGFAAPAEQPSEELITLTGNAVQRMQELLGPKKQSSVLRLTVEAGGCSGFSYKFDLDDRVKEEDRVFESGGVRLVTDDVSFEFVRGATVDFSQELIKSAFEVVNNPNAEKGCGCGTSFAPK